MTTELKQGNFEYSTPNLASLLRARADSIVRWRDEEHMTYDAIGKVLGISRQRVWQIYKAAKAGGDEAPPVVVS